jgi:hypothetical protein
MATSNVNSRDEKLQALHSLPKLRSRLSTDEISKIGKAFIERCDKRQHLNMEHFQVQLFLIECVLFKNLFKVLMEDLGISDVPMLDRVFDIFGSLCSAFYQ